MAAAPAALLAATAIALMAGCVSSGPAEAVQGGEPTEALLYVQTARMALAVPLPDGSYALRLVDVDPRVVYFSDRPVRDAGTVSADALVHAVFIAGAAAPNAALVGMPVGSDHLATFAIELESPQSDASTDSMEYHAWRLDELSDGLSHHSLTETEAIPLILGEVALFIDSDQYHRCWARLQNDSPYTLSLDRANLTPEADSARWTNLPDHVEPGTSATWTFRFHSESADKQGQLRFIAGDDAEHTLNLTMDCNYHGVSQHWGDGRVDTSKSSCAREAFSPLLCNVGKDDKRTLVFEVRT